MTRGILLYGESPREVKDFESAIQSGSTAIWPSFFLAHHSLLGGLFERSRYLSERALEMDGSDAVKSELAEWLAISQSELEYPEEMVQGVVRPFHPPRPFETAGASNLAAFEAAARPIPASIYEIRDRSAIRVSGMSEGRFRPARPRPAA